MVAHSGAGAFLPAINQALDREPGRVFVDAVVPPARGTHTTPERFFGEIVDLTVRIG